MTRAICSKECTMATLRGRPNAEEKQSQREKPRRGRPAARQASLPGGDGFWLEVLEVTKKLESTPLSSLRNT
jgi:hypothetical protein